MSQRNNTNWVKPENRSILLLGVAVIQGGAQEEQQ